LIKVLAISGYKPFELGIFKNDHPSVTFIKAAIKKELPADIPNIFISSVTGQGLQELKDILWNALQEQG